MPDTSVPRLAEELYVTDATFRATVDYLVAALHGRPTTACLDLYPALEYAYILYLRERRAAVSA